jgi:hypothetical protein
MDNSIKIFENLIRLKGASNAHDQFEGGSTAHASAYWMGPRHGG